MSLKVRAQYTLEVRLEAVRLVKSGQSFGDHGGYLWG
jgi:hypothetical protein